MKTRLVQVAVGRFVPLLQDACPHHVAYCLRHGIEYEPWYDPRMGSAWPPEWRDYAAWPPQWRRYAVLAASLTTLDDGDLLVYLDDDVLIVGDENISSALPDGYDLGLVRTAWNVSQMHGRYNVGATWARVNASTRRLYASILAAGPLPAPLQWHDQLVFNRELILSKCTVCELDNRFNYMEGRPRSGPIVIQAWHGQDILQVRTKLKMAVDSAAKKLC